MSELLLDKVQEKQIYDLEIRKLNYGLSSPNRQIISNLSFEVKRGEFLGITGPSGAGKSTLLQIIIGEIDPTSGSVLILGQSPKDYITENPGKIGLVPQSIPLFATGIYENVAFGINPDLIDNAKVNSLLIDLGLENLKLMNSNKMEYSIKKAVKPVLSGGELQRIGIARAMYRNPKILILDEPTSALDKLSAKLFLEFLWKYHGQLTVVAVSHSSSFLNNFDQILEIRKL